MKRYALAAALILATIVTAEASPCPRSLGCGCNLAQYLFGHADRALYLARNWLSRGSAASRGCVGCVAVFSRGRGGHVGVVRSWNGSNPVVYSWGNRRTGWYTAEYSAKRILGLRYVNSQRYSSLATARLAYQQLNLP